MVAAARLEGLVGPGEAEVGATGPRGRETEGGLVKVEEEDSAPVRVTEGMVAIKVVRVTAGAKGVEVWVGAMAEVVARAAVRALAALGWEVAV